MDITNGPHVDTAAGTRLPSAWKLALLALTVAARAGVLVLAIVAVVHTWSPEPVFRQPVTTIAPPEGL